MLLDGKPVLLLCSNNYLGLADHPRVREAAAEAAMRWGVGAGASRLVSGTMTIHRRLEERLAALEGSEACVLFGSGYLANLGTIGALAGRATWSSPTSSTTPRSSTAAGSRGLRSSSTGTATRSISSGGCAVTASSERRRLIVTDSVFSMDGDVAPLAEIVELAKAHGARAIVDEAHATGALGPGGRGAVAEAGLEGEVDVVVGTLGKALGSYGAYVCASEEMIRYLINTARSLIFSTAPGPPAVAGALAALELLQERPAPRRSGCARTRASLRRALAAEGFPVADDGDADRAVDRRRRRAAMGLCEEALRAGRVRPGDPPADRRRRARRGCGWR